MKITYIHQHFSLPAEAGGQRPWEFARRLAGEGHDVTVLCGGKRSLETTVEGVRIRRIAAPYENEMAMQQRIWSFLRFMTLATVESAKMPADLVFASSTPLTTAVPGIIGAVVQRVPMVFEVRDLWPSVPAELGLITNRSLLAMARLLEKLAYSAASTVIALSPGMAAGVQKVSPSTAITLVPNASDFRLFENARTSREDVRRELEWRPDEIILMYAGSFGYTYDVAWLVDLAHELSQLSDKYRVVICGAGAATTDLHHQAESLGLNPAKLLLGSIPKTDVARMLPAADFAVSTMVDAPALEVNSLNKVFDALAAATPVIFNHHGWLPDLLEKANAGMKMPRDPKAAAILLDRVARDGERIREMSANARQLGMEQFDRDKLYGTFRDVLTSTVTHGLSASRSLVGAARRAALRSTRGNHLAPSGKES